MKDDIRIIEIDPCLITGMMLGIEFVQDGDWNSVVIDLLILRVMISWN